MTLHLVAGQEDRGRLASSVDELECQMEQLQAAGAAGESALQEQLSAAAVDNAALREQLAAAAAEAEALREQLAEAQGERGRLDVKVAKHKQVGGWILGGCGRSAAAAALRHCGRGVAVGFRLRSCQALVTWPSCRECALS